MLELIRFETVDAGRVFLRADAILSVAKVEGVENQTIIGFAKDGVTGRLLVEGDPDEVMLQIERCVPGARSYNIA